MTITTRAEYDRWALEVELVQQQLASIERAERAILVALGCPTDPVGIYAILAGERPAPWPKRTAERAKRDARNAMFVLLQINRVRSCLGPPSPNAPAAAYAALIVGALSGDVVRHTITHKHATSAGIARGKEIARLAAKSDREIERLYRTWLTSDELQDQYRSTAAYIEAKKPTLSRKTIERRLKHLRQSRQ